MTVSMNVPIVKASAIFQRGSGREEYHHAVTELTHACHRHGCVILTGHDLEPQLLTEAFNTIKRLFALPQKDKMKAPHPDDPVPHRGYSAPGVEKVYGNDQVESDTGRVREISDFKESYEVGSEDNTVHGNIWLPDELLPGFKQSSLDFFWGLNHLCETILEALATGLNLTHEEHRYLTEEIRSGHNNQLRFLHYPPLPERMQQDRVIARMPAHTDWSLFTVLFQDEHEGLEFEDPQQKGSWIMAQPIKGSVVLNIGDMFERMTNGYFPAATHRVELPTSSKSAVAGRYSIPYFFSPDDTAMITTLESYVKASGEEKRFADVRFADYAGNREKHSYVNGS